MSASNDVNLPSHMRPSLEDTSGWIPFIFMTHLSSLFTLGSSRELQLEDLGGVSREDRSDLLYEEFCKYFAVERLKPPNKRSLLSVMFKATGQVKLCFAFLLFGLSAAVQFGPVLILTRLVKHFAGIEHVSTAGIWVMVALLFVCPMVSSITLAHSNRIMAHVGCQIRNILITVIYRKSLTISASKRHAISTGRILTMFSDDTNQLRLFLYYCNNTVMAPFQIAAALYLIYQQVNVATFVGLGYQFFTVPVAGVMMYVVTKIRGFKMKYTDRRVKMLNEVLNGIRIIKYYAWESAFIKKINDIRLAEVNLLQWMGYALNGTFGFLMLGAPQVQSVLIFWAFTGLNHALDAATAFTTMALFGLMSTPFIFIPYGLQQYNQSLVATRRIMEFLCEDDLQAYIDHNMNDSSAAIEFTNANMSWMDEEETGALQLPETPAGETSKSSPDGNSSPGNYSRVTGDIEMVGSKSAAVDGSAVSEGLNRSVYTLQDINLTIKRGQLVGIVGSVGSGKSSFLAAILGEMNLRSGSVHISDSCAKSIAFCDQRAWIINANVRDNVLFGKEFDEEKFDKALSAAAMTDDLKVLPDGLKTEIGERGINLSGGQKARVSLARAVYNDAELYLLDDPLSAVDAHVGEHIFQKCIVEALAGKTRLLVTHHSHVLPRCDFVIILDNQGKIKAAGSFTEIVSSGVDISQYIVQKEAPKEEDVVERSRSRSNSLSGRSSPSNTPRADTSPRDRSQSKEASSKPSPPLAGDDTIGTSKIVPTEGEDSLSTFQKQHSIDESTVETLVEPPREAKALMTTEERTKGNVPLSTVLAYVYGGGALMFFSTIVLQLCCQVLQIEANFWLSDWGKEETIDKYYKHTAMGHQRTARWMNGYAGMQIASVMLMGISRVVLTSHRTNASRVLHQNLLERVLYFPVAFYDVTPIGRVINRFSQDIATIDEDLAQSISQLVGMGGSVLGAVGGIVGATKGTFLILFLPLIYLYSRFQAYFARSNTSIASIEAVSRSPIYADFSQTLSGTNTIRAYGQQARFIARIENFANENTVPGVFQQVAIQWLSIRLDFVGAVIMLFMGALTASLQHKNFIPAGYLGLGLSYAIQMTAALKLTVRSISQVEAQFNSVDRVLHYTKNIPIEEVHEGEVKIDENELTQWPSDGTVEFENVFMGYRDGDLVLKDVSFKVGSKEKVGIAGRTGCGKSSLMVTLFRIEEVRSGRIIIDGYDIAKLPLNTVRSKLCIIPQDPVMFSDTVRFNVDPFDEYTDTEIWDVLRDVNMHEHISSLPNKLLEMVAEGGENFSAGQRQVCHDCFVPS
jgi:ATP-binding cassette subfamily C (CFTR/MRP) protein 1